VAKQALRNSRKQSFPPFGQANSPLGVMPTGGTSDRKPLFFLRNRGTLSGSVAPPKADECIIGRDIQNGVARSA